MWSKLIIKFSCEEITIPSNLDKLKATVVNIKECYVNNKILIHLFHTFNFLFFQIWCIPGTVLFNLLGGAVFGVIKGTIICLIVGFILILA